MVGHWPKRNPSPKVRDRLPEYLKPAMTFAYFTGWRGRSEVLALRWSKVDFNAGTVRLEPGTTKNKDGWAVFPALRTLLEAQREATLAFQRKMGASAHWCFTTGDIPS